MKPNGGSTFSCVDLLPEDAVEGGEIHPIHVDSSIKVIHLVLGDPCVPALQFHFRRSAQLADPPDSDLIVPFHLSGIASHTHATFGMLVYLAADYLQLRINEDLQANDL